MHGKKKMNLMENGDLSELIESYLDNTLSEEQRREVEQRMANDESFRREVQLHRELQENFSDPARWRLRSTMMEVMQEPISSEGPAFTSKPAVAHKIWKWFILLAAVFIGIGFWYWLKPSADESLKDPIEALPSVEPSSPMTGEQADSVVTETKETISSKQQPEQPLQIALADPANFIPNPSMEAFVNSAFRSHDDLSLAMSSPVNSAAFTPNKKGETLIRFAGVLEGFSESEQGVFVVAIFNNKDVVKPLVSLPLKLKKDNTGWAFDMKQRFKFPLGLYYFTIEHENEIIYTNKFTIGKIKK